MELDRLTTIIGLSEPENYSARLRPLLFIGTMCQQMNGISTNILRPASDSNLI